MASCPQRVHVAKKKTPPPAPAASLVCVPFEGGGPSDPYVRAATRSMSAQRRLAGDCPPPCSARPQTNRLEAAVVPIARGPGFFAHRVRAVRPCADRRRGWSSRARLLRPEDRRQKIAPRSSKARFLPWPADRPTFRLGHGFPPPAACDGGVSRSVMCADRGAWVSHHLLRAFEVRPQPSRTRNPAHEACTPVDHDQCLLSPRSRARASQALTATDSTPHAGTC